MDLKSVLEQVLSPDQNLQKSAENALALALTNDFELTIAGLTDIVKTVEIPDILRQSAALAFKNALSAKDAVERAKRHESWTRVTIDAKVHVKRNLLAAIQTDKAGLGRSIAQCVSAVAVCEFERGDWPELIPFLSGAVTTPQSVCKQHALEAIGYICEEASVETLSRYSTVILTAVINGMRSDQSSVDVRLAAATAFQNSLDFFKEHFAKQDERDYMMQVICETTQAEDVRLKIAALQCIIKIMQLYYEFMEPYVAAGLVPISCRAMSTEDSDEVVLQGIEFWSTLCDDEINLKYQMDHAVKSGTSQSTGPFFGFVAKHLQSVVPCLLQWLARQPDHDEEEWIPAKAATVSLTLIAECVEDEVVPPVVPFVVGNIQSPDWHFRDAACVAFGAILEGPNPDRLKPIVDEAYDYVLRMMADEHMAVRDSAAWVIQRMCEFLGRSDHIPTKRMQETLIVLQQNLNGAPRVASNVCWALATLAKVSYGTIDKDKNGHPQTTTFSPVFSQLVDDLFKTGFRPDSMQNNLRTAAFEAINQLIIYSPQDCYAEVQKVAVGLYNYLNSALEKDATMSATERTRYGDYCQHWFSILESILRRLNPEDVKNVRVNVFSVCLRMLDLHRAGHSFQAEPEALLSLLTLMDLDPKDFSAHLDVLHPYLITALTCYSEHGIVNGALSLVAEICRHYETGVLRFVASYVDHVTALISQLNDPSGMVRPRAISALGDIALSMGPQFFPFAVKSFECLRTIAQPEDPDVWILVLDAVLEACVGLFQSLEADRQDEGRTMLRVYAAFITPLITEAAGQLAAISDDCVGNCAVLMGMLCNMFGREILPVVDRAECYALLSRGKKLKGSKTRTICSLNLKELKRLKELTGISEAVAR